MLVAASLKKRGGEIQKFSHLRGEIAKKVPLGALSFELSFCKSALDAFPGKTTWIACCSKMFSGVISGADT